MLFNLGFKKALRSFLEKENEKHYDKIAMDLLASYRVNDIDFNTISGLWESAYPKVCYCISVQK